MRWAAVERSALLRPGIRAVEEVVKSVNGPVYEKFHLVPDELLRYTVCNHEHDRPVSAASRTTVSEVAWSIYARYEPAVKVVYEAKVEPCTVVVWQRLKPRVACFREKGYRVWSSLPWVPNPMERIAKKAKQLYLFTPTLAGHATLVDIRNDLSSNPPLKLQCREGSFDLKAGQRYNRTLAADQGFECTAVWTPWFRSWDAYMSRGTRAIAPFIGPLRKTVSTSALTDPYGSSSTIGRLIDSSQILDTFFF
ncbi:hypothetical protein RJT34_04397 [Clitoria ternatea]|uniref:Uncharacterized protein n=1 Tax=Clitoria ternatea TaxID=43366 RepID=A0AAN9KPM7_CLITE